MSISLLLLSRIASSKTVHLLGAIVVWCSFLGLPAPAQATSYDASAFLSVAAGEKVPFGTSLTLLPGVTVTPPPSSFGQAGATRSATANVPGQVFATASGLSTGSGVSFGTSSAGAFGFGSLLVSPQFYTDNVKFPLVMHEDWSITASGGGNPPIQFSEATIRLQVLLDGLALHSVNRTVVGPAGGSAFASNQATTPTTVDVSPGFHSLLFSAEAQGIAVTPEPATLLLFGTTAAGLGLARWRQRRRRQRTAIGN